MKKLIISTLLITLFITLLAGCTPSGTPTMTTTMMPTTMMTTAMMGKYQDLTPMEAKALIDKTPELIIIDVSPKYAEGHLPAAINYYVGDGSLDKATPMLDKTKTYLVYCHTDSASMLGAQKLVDAGFKSVYRLIGNYAAWVAAGYSVEK